MTRGNLAALSIPREIDTPAINTVQGSQGAGVGMADLLKAEPAFVAARDHGHGAAGVLQGCFGIALAQPGKSHLHLAPHLAGRHGDLTGNLPLLKRE